MSKIRSPPLKLNFLYKPVPKKKEISLTLKIVFSLLLAFFSLDFGFIKFKSPRICVFIKFLCALQTLIVGTTFTYNYSLNLNLDVFKIWYTLLVLKYIVIVLVLLLTTKSSFYNFCNDLWSIDVELGIEGSSQLEFLILTGIVFCMLARCFLLLVLYCNIFMVYCIKPTYLLILYFMPIGCGDIFLIFCFIVYYMLYKRLEAFTNLISNGYTDIVASQYLYKSIVDVADDIKSVFNPLYVVPLLINTIDIMITVFYPLIEHGLTKNGSVHVTTANASTPLVFLVQFLPAYAAGLVSAQVDRLKLVLHERLLQDRDQKHTIDIERFLRYIEVRSLRTTIWKIIPLDWQLPVIFVNLSVTYLIVMLQFTHKY